MSPPVGGKNSKKCTLILTEGDSALSFAIAGISVWGHAHYGAFPLKGCPVNPRDEKMEKIVKNEEYCNIKTIIGLKDGVDSPDGLRYGRVLLLTDSDQVGDMLSP